MYKLFISPQTYNDLEIIYEFTLSNWGYKQAEKYQDDIYDPFISISENPEIGSIYIFKKGDYRKLNCNKHLILNRIQKKKCLIIRVLHERLDLVKHMD